MATEHKLIPDAELHEPVGVAAASSGQVYVADGAGSGAWTAQAATLSTVQNVESAADFPTPVADVITLAPNCVYFIANQIDVGNDRFVFSEGSILQGVHRTISGIASTTTGVLFSGTGVNMRFETLTLDASSATHLYSFNGSGTKVLSARDILSTTHTGIVASITDALNTIIDFSVYSGGTDGITFAGSSNGGLIMSTSAFLNYTGTGLDLGTAVLTGSRMSNCSVIGTGGADVGMDGASGSANIATGSTFFVTNNNFTGGTTPLQGIEHSDLQFKFQDNNGIPDTHQEGQGYIRGNVETTAIAVIDTPVLADVGVLFLENHAEQFTVSTGGRLTYNGIDDEDFMVHCTMSGTTVSSTQTYTLYISVNGTPVDASGISREYSSTATGVVTTFVIVSLTTGDYVEAWLENNTNTVDFDITDLNIAVR